MSIIDNRASSPRFQSTKTILRSQNASFKYQYDGDNVYEYVEISKQNKIPDIKQKPTYDQDYKYPKYVIFCSKSAEIEGKKTKSPQNQSRKNSLESPNLPAVQPNVYVDDPLISSRQRSELSNELLQAPEHDVARRLSEASSEIISKFKNLIDYEQNYGHAYSDLYAQGEHSYEYVDTERPTRFHVQKIEESKSQNNENILDLQSQQDDHVYEALESRPSRFRVTKVDESILKSQNVYEPICVRPRWVDYLFIPPPHKRAPKKDSLGRVEWLNRPVRKKKSVGQKSLNSRKNSENLDSHTYENTKPICDVTAAPIVEPQLTTEVTQESDESSKNLQSSNNISEELLVKPEPEVNPADSSDEDVSSGMRTYEAVFL